MLGEQAIAALLGLGASDVAETRMVGGRGLIEKGHQVLHDRPQVREAIQTTLGGIADRLSVSPGIVKGVLDFALPLLIEKIGTAAADWEMQHRGQDGTGMGLAKE